MKRDHEERTEDKLNTMKKEGWFEVTDPEHGPNGLLHCANQAMDMF